MTKEIATNLTERQKYAARITKAMSGTVQAILETGQLLVEAKVKLKHGDWLELVENDLPFEARTAQRLMAITHDTRLTNTTHASYLPPNWTTLYQLSQLHDDEFERGIEQGVIRPDMKRSEVKRLHAVPGHLVDPPAAETGEEAEIQQAITIIHDTGRASTSALQRRLRIGFTRASRLMDILEERGVIGPPRGSDPREILVKPEESAISSKALELQEKITAQYEAQVAKMSRAELADALLLLLCKRAVDGLNNRCWDACPHHDFESKIAEVFGS